MNIDFIEATLFTGKDTPFFGCMKKIASYESGNVKYILNGCEKIEVIFNEESGKLVLRGSIMYFMQGHNFTYSKKLFVEGVNYVGKLLHLNLWNMMINIFENGVVVKVKKNPKDYIQHHREGRGMQLYETPKDAGNFRSFNDKYVERKFYNAGRNIMHKQGVTMKQVIEGAGWNPDAHYIKWEMHYLKPECLLNDGKGLHLSDLVNPDWEKKFDADLYNQYCKIKPMKTIISPTDKADLHTLDFFAIELVETKMNEGKTLEEVRKILYDRINSSSVLSKADKDARKRQVKATLEKFQQSEISEWDLKEELRQAIFGDECTSIDEQPAIIQEPALLSNPL